MRAILTHPILIASVRYATALVLLTACLPEQMTFAARRETKLKGPHRISVSTLKSLPVVSITSGAEQLCSGVLVTSKSIITSKQCLSSFKHKRRKRGLIVKVGAEQRRVFQIISNKQLNLGIIRLNRAFQKTKPTTLYSVSRMAFGRDFVVAGFSKAADGEIGYLNAIYTGSKFLTRPRAVSCFGNSGMPALVRRPTAVVGIATYGFGECFFDSEVTFENVGSPEVLKFVRKNS